MYGYAIILIMKIKKLFFFITHPRQIYLRFALKKLNKNVGLYDDVEFIKKKYRIIFGKEINLEYPKTFNEHINWMKLYFREPILGQLVDKIAVREYVKEKIGDKHLVPIIGTFDTPDDIDFNKLPDKFVLKCNHNAHEGMFFCRGEEEKRKLNIPKIKENLIKGLKEDHYLISKEWPYSLVKPRILCEQLLEEESQNGLADYKLFYFNGEFKLLKICTDRFSKFAVDWYDKDLHHLNVLNEAKNREKDIVLDKKVINEMIVLGKKLVSNFPECRVDFYYCNETIYFGEMTFFESSGFLPFTPSYMDEELGKLFDDSQFVIQEKTL